MAKPKEIEKGVWRLDSCYKRKRKTFRGTSSKEVKRLERDWMKEIDDYGKELAKRKINFIELMKQHLFINIKDSVKEGTFERYMCAYREHLSKYENFDKDVKEIDQNDLKIFFNSKKELSKSSLKIFKILINGTLNYAEEMLLIRENPMNKVKMTKSSYKSNRMLDVFTEEEQKKYLKCVSKTIYNELLTLAFATGLRQGELIALRWKNVNFKTNTIHVRESSRRIMVYDDEGNFEYKTIQGTTKTTKSERDIPISETISNMLRKLKLKNGASEKDFVFVSAKGEKIKNDTLQVAHRRFCKECGIRTINFHCIRHTFATRMIQSGVDVKTLSELMGHADVSITLNRYVHTSDDNKRAAMNKISKLISTL